MNIRKGWVMLTFLFSIMFSISAQDIKLPARPDPPRLVTDMAGMLTAEEADLLEAKLLQYNDSTSTQIAVVTINSLDGAEIAQYATELGAKWGVGHKAKDNGVLMLISKGDHKMFIATGRGVEADLPDIFIKQIIDHVMKPQFKAEKYYSGINDALDAMISKLSGQYSGDEIAASDTVQSQDDPKMVALWIVLVIFGLFLLVFLFDHFVKHETIGSAGASSLGFLFNIAGTVISVAGDSGGSSSSSGGSDFGGFGGGDFGGGGAGGDW
jgi:uncharacterized protein